MLTNIENYHFYSIFILFLIITSNYLSSVLPCKIQDLFTNNIYFKHIFGYFTMVFLVLLTVPYYKITIEESLKQSVFFYFWFILMSKTNKYVFILLCILLGIAYMLTIKVNDVKTNITLKDPKANVNENKDIIRLNKYTSHLYDAFMIITVIGFLFYLFEKKKEYKKKFNYFTFILGKTTCRND